MYNASPETVAAAAKVTAHTSDELKAAVAYDAAGDFDYENPAFVAIWNEVGTSSNPTWVSARIADVLYDRDEITGDEMDRITE